MFLFQNNQAIFKEHCEICKKFMWQLLKLIFSKPQCYADLKQSIVRWNWFKFLWLKGNIPWGKMIRKWQHSLRENDWKIAKIIQCSRHGWAKFKKKLCTKYRMVKGLMKFKWKKLLVTEKQNCSEIF